MKITPCLDRVLFQPEAAPERSKGGIIIPKTTQEDRSSQQGVVIAVGPKVTSIKVGDRLLAPRYVGQQVRVDETDYTLVPEAEILGVISSDE